VRFFVHARGAAAVQAIPILLVRFAYSDGFDDNTHKRRLGSCGVEFIRS
jgi:hypothetical protein